LRIPKTCRYCGGKVILTDSSEIYGKSYGKIYMCTNCNAFTGVHQNSDKPLGTLANSILRVKRKEAHQVFDAFWKRKKMSREKGNGAAGATNFPKMLPTGVFRLTNAIQCGTLILTRLH
jgi:hypothetical protein